MYCSRPRARGSGRDMCGRSVLLRRAVLAANRGTAAPVRAYCDCPAWGDYWRRGDLALPTFIQYSEAHQVRGAIRNTCGVTLLELLIACFILSLIAVCTAEVLGNGRMLRERAKHRNELAL